MCVPFAEAAKAVLSVQSENVGTQTVNASAIRLSSENMTSGFSPV